MGKTNFEHALSETVLKEAATEYEAEACREAAEEFGEAEFEFSAEHEEKMKKIFAGEKKNPWRVLKWAASIAAVFVICFTAAMQVEAFATPVKDALFGHTAMTKSLSREYDVYHPKILSDPIAKINVTLAFEFTGQSAKIIYCNVETKDNGSCVLETEHKVEGDTVKISYKCQGYEETVAIPVDVPDAEYTADIAVPVLTVLVEETLMLEVLPDGNVNGFV